MGENTVSRLDAEPASPLLFTQLISAVTKLQGDLSKALQDAKTARSEADSAQSSADSLKKQLQALRSCVQKAAAELRREKDHWQAQAKAAQAEREDCAKTISSLEYKLQSLLESRDQNQKEAKEKQYRAELELSLRSEENGRMQNQLKSYGALLGTLEAEVAKARTSMQEVKASVSDNCRLVAGYEDKLRTMVMQEDEWLGKLRKQAACIKAMRSKLQEREANLNQQADALQQAQCQLVMRKGFCRDRELAAATAAMDGAKAECKEHIAMKGRLMQQLQKSNELVAESRAAAERHLASLDSLRNQFSPLDAQALGTKAHNEATVKAQRDEIEQLQLEVKHLRKKLSSATDGMEASGSVPGKSQTSDVQEHADGEQLSAAAPSAPVAALPVAVHPTSTGGAEKKSAPSCNQAEVQQHKQCSSTEQDPPQHRSAENTDEHATRGPLPRQQQDSMPALIVHLGAGKRTQLQDKTMHGPPLPAFATDTPDELEIDSDVSQPLPVPKAMLIQKAVSQTVQPGTQETRAANKQQRGSACAGLAAPDHKQQAAEMMHAQAVNPRSTEMHLTGHSSQKPAEASQPATLLQGMHPAAGAQGNRPAEPVATPAKEASALPRQQQAVHSHGVSVLAAATKVKLDMTDRQPRFPTDLDTQQCTDAVTGNMQGLPDLGSLTARPLDGPHSTEDFPEHPLADSSDTKKAELRRGVSDLHDSRSRQQTADLFDSFASFQDLSDGEEAGMDSSAGADTAAFHLSKSQQQAGTARKKRKR